MDEVGLVVLGHRFFQQAAGRRWWGWQDLGSLELLFHGLKGSDFYLHNPWFHAKLGAFLLAALVSLWPTVAFLRWRRALRADPAWRPDPAQAARLRGLVRIELVLIAVILVCAAAMPRYGALTL